MRALEPQHTAIVAVHLQNDIAGTEGPAGELLRPEIDRAGVLPTTARVLTAGRAAGVRVVYTRIAFQPGYPDLVANSPLMNMVVQTNLHVEGTSGPSIVEEVKPEAADLVVTHQRLSGFHATPLDVLLRASGIDTVVVCGVATNLSVESTARTASDLGYRTLIIADACVAVSQPAHSASLESLGFLAEIVTSEELLAALASGTTA